MANQVIGVLDTEANTANQLRTIKIIKDKEFFNMKVQRVVLENKEDNHYKQYHLSQTVPQQFREGHKYLAEWGRIGVNKKQSKWYEGNERTTMWDQMNKKIAKGYKVIRVECFGDRSLKFEEYMASLGNCELLD